MVTNVKMQRFSVSAVDVGFAGLRVNRVCKLLAVSGHVFVYLFVLGNVYFFDCVLILFTD